MDNELAQAFESAKFIAIDLLEEICYTTLDFFEEYRKEENYEKRSDRLHTGENETRRTQKCLCQKNEVEEV